MQYMLVKRYNVVKKSWIVVVNIYNNDDNNNNVTTNITKLYP